MACDRFTEAIRARALGSRLRADAAAHLAVCSDCQAALDTEEQVLAAIDTALADLASTGPAQNFVSRLRAHVEHAPGTPGAWWMPADVAPLALLVAAVVVVVGAVVMSRLPRERSAVREASASRPVDVTVVAPAERSADPSLDAARPETTRHARVRRQPAPEPARLAQTPEVLVPEQQREAVSRLFASLRAGRPEVISMLMSLHGGESGTDSRGLMIAPLRIEPVVVAALPSPVPLFEK
jgi:hypothetical protein